MNTIALGSIPSRVNALLSFSRSDHKPKRDVDFRHLTRYGPCLYSAIIRKNISFPRVRINPTLYTVKCRAVTP